MTVKVTLTIKADVDQLSKASINNTIEALQEQFEEDIDLRYSALGAMAFEGNYSATIDTDAFFRDGESAGENE
jgi:hypothetical protein